MSPSDSRGSGSNPHTSSHGRSGEELTKRPLSEPTSKQTNGNCNANQARPSSPQCSRSRLDATMIDRRPHLEQEEA